MAGFSILKPSNTKFEESAYYLLLKWVPLKPQTSGISISDAWLIMRSTRLISEELQALEVSCRQHKLSCFL